MKVSLGWLREYVRLSLPAKEIAERLTMAGLEASVSGASGGWDRVWVGQIVQVSPHPNADKLKLVTVDVGTSRPTVVSGAPNLKVGDKVPFAGVGARLIDGHTGQPAELKPAKIRGISSEGMVCSEKELGISELHEGIMVLPPGAPLGVPLAEYLGETFIEVDITPNRPDCLSILGVAREVSAITGQPLSSPPLDYPQQGHPITELATVEVQAPDLCPRYTAGLVRGVKIGPSPAWLQRRLEGYGMRPISNIVDVTNYVMVEMGQPLHAFDYETLRGRRIIVRRARRGERLVSLDGAERELNPEMLVIADAERAVALAGIMGGRDTEVSPGTTSILLEGASFTFPQIRATSRALGLATEASLRFGRGLSPGHTLPAMQRAMKLFLELAGGEAASGLIDVYPGRKESQPIPLPLASIASLLGVAVEAEEVARILSALGFTLEEKPGGFLVQAPPWRSDVELPADLVEEVARIRGYEQLPTTLIRAAPPPPRVDPLLGLRERVRDLLVACGLQEVITYVLTSQARAGGSSLRVTNPLSRDQEYLRTSLRPGLLSVLGLNQKYDEVLRFFEIGRVYLPREGDLPQEKEIAAVALMGARRPPSWQERGEKADFFDAKGVAQELLARLGVESSLAPSQDPALHPARQGKLLVGGEEVGVLGEVHPSLAREWELEVPAFVLELDLEKLVPLLTRRRPYQPLPRFPAVTRDLALVVEERVPAGRVLEVLRSHPLVAGAALFDVYTGKPIPSGKKSLAYHLVFQSPSKTLTDEEVDQALGSLLERLKQELGATLRS